jgi:tetratricopeptide (TPR) repeat protein
MTDNSSSVKSTHRHTSQVYLWVLKLILCMGVLTMAAWLVGQQLQQEAGLRELVVSVNRLPENEQLKPIACSRTPLEDGPEKAALEEAVLRLRRPAQRATAFCLLGDYPSALAAYEQSAAGGDDRSALQVYFLQAHLGDTQAAKQALSSVHLSNRELRNFFYDVTDLKLNIDVLPVARRATELYPNDPTSWRLWRDAAQEYQNASDWQRALDAYLEAIQVQEKVGVSIGRSSFELGAGRMYQTRLEPHDLNKALSFYNSAIDDMDFLGAENPSNVFLYRGEVYQGLRLAYTAQQALQEFLRSLELNPKNYWAVRAIGGVYLWDLKNYPQAEYYINLAIGLNPDRPEAYVTRGDFYRQQGDLKAAAAAYKDALAHQPGYQPAVDRLAAVQAELQKQAP